MNLFSSERNHNWLIWIWCIKFHLFLWKLSDVFIAINRFANKFNIYINFVQLCYQFYPPNVLLALFSAQLFYLSPVPLLIFGVAASHRKEAHFLTVAWFCAWGWSKSFCTSSSLLTGSWHHLSAMKLTLSTRFIISSSSWSKGFPSKTYLIPLQCYIISLQQRYTRLFICLDALT